MQAYSLFLDKLGGCCYVQIVDLEQQAGSFLILKVWHSQTKLGGGDSI